MMKDLRSLTYEQLCEEVKAMGQPSFRAKQIYSWLHEKRAEDYSEMSNLPAALREKLSSEYALAKVSIERRMVSKIDGTVKYLFKCFCILRGKSKLTRNFHYENHSFTDRKSYMLLAVLYIRYIHVLRRSFHFLWYRQWILVKFTFFTVCQTCRRMSKV